jgi:hypothetical protein
MLLEALETTIAGLTVSDLPTDVEGIARQLGISQVLRRPISMDAMLVPTRGGYTAVLKESHSTLRQRFSLAHEAAHTILHKRAESEVEFRWRVDKEEARCNELAAQILMPKHLFTQMMNKLGSSVASVPKLASSFQVSTESAAIRLTDFLPFPAVLSKWKPDSRQPLVLTHGWSRANEQCRPYRFGLPRGNKARRVRTEGPNLAFQSAGVVRTEEPLFVTRRSKSGDDCKWATFPTESMAFGSGEYRYVLSLSHVGKDSFTL